MKIAVLIYLLRKSCLIVTATGANMPSADGGGDDSSGAFDQPAGEGDAIAM